MTWNPADKSSNVTLSNGNLSATSLGAGNGQVRATVGYSTGKYYFEIHLDGPPVSNSPFVGIRPTANTLSGVGAFGGGGDYGAGTRSPNDGHSDYVPGSGVAAVPPPVASGDVYMIAVDLGAGKLWIGINGTWDVSGNPSTGANPMAAGISGSYAAWAQLLGTPITARFTRSSMSYTVPTGFLAYDGT